MNELAKFIAHRIFENGSCGSGKTATRIEFKHRISPREEIALGGYTEGPLTDAIFDAIRDFTAQREGEMRPRGENLEYDKLRDRYDALAAELATWHQIGTANAARIEGLEAALTLLTNGLKYPTEVVTIAREALGAKP